MPHWGADWRDRKQHHQRLPRDVDLENADDPILGDTLERRSANQRRPRRRLATTAAVSRPRPNSVSELGSGTAVTSPKLTLSTTSTASADMSDWLPLTKRPNMAKSNWVPPGAPNAM